MALLRFLLSSIGTLVFLLALAYIGSTWRISNADLEPHLEQLNIFNYLQAMDTGLDLELEFIAENNPFQVVNKDKLTAADALLNGFSLYVSSATVIPFVLIVLLAVWIGQIVVGDIVGFIIVPLLGAIVVFLVPFAPVVAWLAMLFQDGTGHYYMLWLIIGLPAIGLGYASLAAPSYVVIILIPK